MKQQDAKAKDYSHIKTYEDTLDLHEQKIEELNKILDVLEENLSGYQELMEYYYSEKWQQDLEDDSNGLLPEDLKRGVLSEDGIYNVLAEVNDTAIRMMELGIKYLKGF